MNYLVKKLIENYPDLEECAEDIEKAVSILSSSYHNEGKLLVCGNGGSAADSEHIVGELVKGFMKERPLPQEEKKKFSEYFLTGDYLADNLQGALPAISLTSQMALFTAYSNDITLDMAFAQQVYAYGKENDVLMGLSTSGNSANVVNALRVAEIRGLKTIGLTGKDGGKMKELCDCIIRVPLTETPVIQERHLPIYHTICRILEEEFFEK